MEALTQLLVTKMGELRPRGKDEGLLGFKVPSCIFLPGLQGGTGSPAPHVALPHSPWLSSGSQKHFFSSGTQVQLPTPALIPQRSPGSCPPMMLPPPGDRGSLLSLLGDLAS